MQCYDQGNSDSDSFIKIHPCKDIHQICIFKALCGRNDDNTAIMARKCKLIPISSPGAGVSHQPGSSKIEI